jgi:undecaprenyl-diphosphatase
MAVGRAAWSYITTHDYRLMRRVHRWYAPRWLQLLMIVSTRLGDGWLWYGVGVLLLFSGGRRRFDAIGAGVVAALLGIGVFLLLKQVSRRTRPCDLEPHCWSMITPADEFSFPSGHAITAFAVAMVLGRYYPHFEWWLLLAATSIAVSRILLGMHFLSDVVAGSAMGMAIGEICIRLARRF